MHRISKESKEFLEEKISKINEHNIDYTLSRSFTTLKGISKQIDFIIGTGNIYYYDTYESRIKSHEVTVD